MSVLTLLIFYVDLIETSTCLLCIRVALTYHIPISISKIPWLVTSLVPRIQNNNKDSHGRKQMLAKYTKLKISGEKGTEFKFHSALN